MFSMSGKERPRVRDVALSTGMVKTVGSVGLCEVVFRHNCSVLNQHVRHTMFEIRMKK